VERIYQIYDLLRKFLESTLGRYVFTDTARDVNIDLYDGRTKTLEQWTNEFMDSMISGEECLLTSSRAEKHWAHLTGRPQTAEEKEAALVQITESIIAYLLDIMPNQHNYTSFRAADFRNNHHTEEQLISGMGNSKRFALIEELCNAEDIWIYEEDPAQENHEISHDEK
jgi:hypothetical protein